MLKTKKIKFLLVLALVFSLLLPYATPVMAITVSKDEILKQSDLADDETLKLTGTERFANNAAATYYRYYSNSGSGTPDKVVNQIVIIDKDGNFNYKNPIYCIDATKGLEGNGTTYANLGDFMDKDSSTELSSYIENIGEANYNSILWIAQNMYLESDTEYLSDFLNKVYGQFFEANDNSFKINGETKSPEDFIKSVISLNDIHLIQQYAIWYFANSGELNITEDQSVANAYPKYGYDNADDIKEVKSAYKMGSGFKVSTDGNNYSGFENKRESALNMMLSYLITNAKNKSGEIVSSEYPEFDDTIEATFSIAELDNASYYKFGPFSISNVENTNYNITLDDTKDSEISEYVLKDKDGNSINSVTTLNDIPSNYDGEFYVYVPIEKEIDGVRINIEYTQKATAVTLWEKQGSNRNKWQPVILITRADITDSKKEVKIGKSDLALRKYIVAINDVPTTARTPKVDATGLLKGDANAIYAHRKDAVEISKDDTITYEIRVYNEGETDAVVKKVKDIMPDGLELVSGHSDNADWSVDNGIATIDLNKTLSKRDETKIKNASSDSIDGGLDSTAVRITLKIKDDASEGAVLTNVAEILDTNLTYKDENGNVIDTDADSDVNTIKKSDITDGYIGNSSNSGKDLSNSDEYFEGLQDDDDFERIKVKDETPVLDLALKKFITAVNGVELTGSNSREPSVNTQRLKDYLNGTTTISDATYTTKKTPLTVKKGDIVTYTIRVYNEGSTDAYAEKITDYIPEGLGYIVGTQINVDNDWRITSFGKGSTISLSSVENAVENAKKFDKFSNLDDTSIEAMTVVKGSLIIETEVLGSGIGTDAQAFGKKENIISAFDGGNKLDYKDVEVTCVVLADEVKDNNLKNTAEIAAHSIGKTNDNGTITVITDGIKERDSEPGNVLTKPGEDDDDNENLTMETEVVEEKVYDLALQKFITAVDGTAVTDRVPTVTVKDGKVQYNHSTEALPLGNGQLVEYTIRVYNEGKTEAYAAQVADDLPKGLEFLPDNETNKKYGWEYYDKDGNVTTNASLAVTVRTNYLAMENGTDKLINGFDTSKDKEPKYQDLKIVFKVNEEVLEKTKTTEKRTITNTAEITKETDTEGNDVTDQDSTPNNWTTGEDDLDQEKVYVKYFDLELDKKLVKVVVSESGRTTEYNLNDDTLFKVELNKKKLSSTVVKFVYQITVTNTGEIDGYAKEVKDYIPDGLEFVSDDNTGWYNVGANVVGTEALAETLLTANGGSASVNITLKWINGENNMGKKTNVAEISKDANEFNSSDVDSTPDNQKSDEDDIDNAPVMLGISTGAEKSYYGIIVAVAVIMTTGVVLIKKYVL